MMILANLVLAGLALPLTAVCIYLLALTLLSARLPTLPRSSRQLRFDVVVPAHNESAVIDRVLASLHNLDWPPERFRVLVVADNCDDATAQLARIAGAQVLERQIPTLRGKGYALRHAFDYSLNSAWAHSIAIVDADSEVSPNLLEAFASRIEAGAGAVQVRYGVLNPEDSWRAGLLAIAHGSFHNVRSRARERLGLSCGLRGNGWCVTHQALNDVPYRAFSLTEDLEYGIALGFGGKRVQYADEAFVNAEMENSERGALRQRQRWEDGRFDLMRSRTVSLLGAAMRTRSLVCLDLALDLLVPPLSYIALNIVILVLAADAASHWRPPLGVWLWAGAINAVCVLIYVGRGWQLSGRGVAGSVDLMCAPFFILWKVLRTLREHDRREWAPTRRRGP